jgi:hypothetical protein
VTSSLAPAPRPRRVRWGRWVAALVVLLLLLIGADRVSAALAENAAATTFQNSEHLDQKPSVKIHGFPFLTQLVSGTLDEVTSVAKDVVVGDSGRTLRISKVSIRLNDVHVARSLSSVRAETASAHALISYSDLSQTLGVKISFAGRSSDGSGRVKATKTVSVDGQQISGDVSAQVSVSRNVLSFESPQVAVDGVQAPDEVADALASVFGAPIRLSPLPFGVTVESVTATAAGVTITLTGANLTYGS